MYHHSKMKEQLWFKKESQALFYIQAAFTDANNHFAMSNAKAFPDQSVGDEL
jgi:hypothetical protein